MKFCASLAARWRSFKCRNDIHTVYDAVDDVPLYFVEYTCRHCQKAFQL